MAEDLHERAKQCCVLLDQLPGGGHCSGYVVAPGRVATAWHGVRQCEPTSWYGVTVGYDSYRRSGRVRLMKYDAAADAAILELADCSDLRPLPVVDPPARSETWHAFGFPGTARSKASGELAGLPLAGTVTDPHLDDFGNVSRLLLYSDQIAAGQASQLHGWSGSPVISGEGLVGHLVRHIGDQGDSHRPAYGYVRACPIEAVLKLLDVQPVRATRRRSTPELAAEEPEIPLLAAWCDREAILGAADAFLRRAPPHHAGLLCIVGHAEDRQDLLMQRIADELRDPPYSISARAVDVVRYFDGPQTGLQQSVLHALGLRGENELALHLERQGLGLLMSCYYVSCGTWSSARIEKLLSDTSAWLDQLDTGGRRFLLTLVLRFETPTLLSWFMQRRARVVKAVNSAYARELAKPGAPLGRCAVAPPIELEAFSIDRLRNWVRLPRVRNGLGLLAQEMESIFNSGEFPTHDRRYAELVKLVEQRRTGTASTGRPK